jgi:hypothetical protein
MDELMEHEASTGQEVQACQHRGQALIVAGEAAEAAQPGETAFHDPASGRRRSCRLPRPRCPALPLSPPPRSGHAAPAHSRRPAPPPAPYPFRHPWRRYGAPLSL